MTNDLTISKNSLRISLSHLTKKEELDVFVRTLKNIVDGLKG
jgi:cysteine sulfinate desulfinase/cysteine desulfurase-like protein